MSIRLFNSAGGYIDLESGGNSSTANVFTLPAETGTILTSASSLAAASLTGNVASARIVSALNAEGSAPIYACRAWVNFNGTGTVAIRASGNVSSITDGGTGTYTVNFTTAMPDANYCVATGPGNQGGNGNTFTVTSFQTTSVLVYSWTTAATIIDNPDCNIAIFR